MEGIGGSLRVLSRSSSSSSSPGAATPSPSSFSIPLSSSSIPYTSSSSSFTFPPPPSHTLSPPPSYPPPCPPLPSLSLLPHTSVSTPAFTTNNPIHSGAKITILTSSSAASSSSSLPSSVPTSSSSSIPSSAPADTSCSTAPGQGPSVGALGEATPPSNGVVVVGAIGRLEEDVSQLLNRLLDAQVFGVRGEFCQENSISAENDPTASVSDEVDKQEVEFADSIQQLGATSNGNNHLHTRERLAEKRFEEEEGQSLTVSAFDELARMEKGQYKDAAEPSSGNLQKHTAEGKNARKVDVNAKHSPNHKSYKACKRVDWMKRRLSYYYDEEKGVVYVQFAWGSLPMQWLKEDISLEGLPSLLEQSEANSLRGLLYMFSVCHVILLVQEGARVDTHLLRTLRILQNAKHMLAPFVKTQVLPGLLPSPSATGRASSVRSLPRSTGHSPGRSGAVGRNASTIALMSGSAPSLFPGQCTPVLLFVFLEDFTDASVSSFHVSLHNDDNSDASGSSTSQGTSTSHPVGPIFTSRQTSQIKGSNPVVMLARSTNKAEGGLRKKLQSSLEAQIRFLVKKCRIISGSGDAGPGVSSGMGPRGSISGTVGGCALFVLDTTRVVCLVDRGPNLKGEALEAAMGVMDDMLRGKEVADNALMDLTGSAGEDIQAVKDFLWRQAEILRGRGGVLTNSTGGSMGVGMVAAAAAAAAASAAAGAFGGSGGALKPLGNPPELPSMSSWLSACQILVEALAAGEGQAMEDVKKGLSIKVAQSSRSSRKGSMEFANLSTQGRDALGETLGCLECGMGLDMKFSVTWCKRMLPSALEVYLKGLPPCYPTSFHKSHLEKALRAFQAMVRGPAVLLYTGKLKEECEAVWKSGRQLCDAVSLTGKPCIHQVHEALQLPTASMPNDTTRYRNSETKEHEKMGPAVSRGESTVKPHSSGMVFLHACACGRSRRLRDDPFDYENANVTFFQFPNCENLLPSLKIPDCEGNKPLGGSAWSLVRLGGSKYYQRSEGLLQSGFCYNKKFLSAWTISFMSGNLAQGTQDTPVHAHQQDQQEAIPRASRPFIGNMTFLDALGQGKTNVRSQTEPLAPLQVKPMLFEKKSKVSEKVQLNQRKPVPFKGAGLASDDRRLFADVAARSSYDGDLAFPPLQQRQMPQPGPISTKNARQAGGKEKKDYMQSTQVEPRATGKAEQVVAAVGNSFQNDEYSPMYNQEKGRIAMPQTVGVAALSSDRSQAGGMIEHTTVYVGFEHECPRGHRFLLSCEQLEQLGSKAVLNEEHSSRAAHKVEKSGAATKLSKHLRKVFHSTENVGAPGSLSGIGQESYLKPPSEAFASTLKLPESVRCKVLDEGSGEGYALLNMNLPIYMSCPYCSKISDQSKKNAVAFAGNISQLQRIFLVTPPLPLLLAACPVVQFDKSCVPEVVKQRESCNEFSLGCSVVLPPESFVSLRLPFVYYVELDDGSRQPLNCKAYQPENTAWLLKGSTFKIISNDGSVTNV